MRKYNKICEDGQIIDRYGIVIYGLCEESFNSILYVFKYDLFDKNQFISQIVP